MEKKRTRHHFVYIMTCSDGALYTGYTTDPARRLKEHNEGTASKYTRGRRPVRLSFLERFKSVGEALKREHQIKKLDRRSKLFLCRTKPVLRVPSSR